MPTTTTAVSAARAASTASCYARGWRTVLLAGTNSTEWLLDPGAVDMPAAFQDFLRLLRPEPADAPDEPDVHGG
ncbi:hypothetical protein ACFRCW_31050 [Streptomyces sp. NPDC056653]|uniref:hypothetical protein n=1 Tax=Streptomyces sp. NPDC056653 TaxID=3345894 RepID=UPI0036CB83E4